MKSWHEKKNFWKEFEERLFPESRLEKAKEEVGFIINITKLKPPAKVLDFPCGVARHSLIFSKLGYDVTGVDITQRYLKRASRQAKKEKVELTLKQGDIRKYKEIGKYDLVINLFTSFGYFKKLSDDKRVLKNIHRSLKPGGHFVIDIMGKEILARIFRDSNAYFEEEGSIFVEIREISDDWGWIKNKWIICEDGKNREYDVEHRVYSATELKWLLKETGFRVKKCYGDFNVNMPYDRTAKRLIIHAVKKKTGKK